MIYLFVIILLLIGIFKYDLSNVGERKKMPLLYFIGFALFCIAAFRCFNGGDTLNYYMLFKEMPTVDRINGAVLENYRYQPGYIYFVSLLKSFWDNFLIQQIVLALIVNIAVFRFVKEYSPYAFFTILVYFLLNYFEFNMEIERESVAISLSLMAYGFLSKKRYLFAVLFIFVAFEFHVSALIAVLMPFVAKIKFSKKSFLIVLVFAALLPSLYLAIPDLKFYANFLFNQEDWVTENYVQQSFSETLNMNYYIMHIIKYLIVPFSMIWFVNKRIDFQYNGFIYAYALLQLLSMFSYAFYRFANYFAPFFWILVAITMCSILRSAKGVRFVGIIIFLFLFLYMYQIDQLQWDSHNQYYFYNRYIPYKSIFLNPGY